MALLVLAGVVAWLAIVAFQPRQPDQVVSCATNWTSCVDNADLVNNYLSDHHAQTDCKQEAKKRAAYGSPNLPSLFFFDSFQVGNDYPRTGIAILIEKEAQFQNGFGAMVNSSVRADPESC